MSPIREPAGPDATNEFLPMAVNVPPWLKRPKDPHWRPVRPSSLKFVDDSVHVNVINMRALSLMKKKGKLVKVTTALESQAMMEHIVTRAQ